jgi:hypothetical protein
MKWKLATANSRCDFLPRGKDQQINDLVDSCRRSKANVFSGNQEMVMGITPGRERGHCLLLAKLDRMGSQEANRKIKTVKFLEWTHWGEFSFSR